MTDDAVRQLAGILAEPAGPAMYLRRATVTEVSRSANTYSITLGGTTMSNVPAFRGVAAIVGDAVDVLFDGPAPRIVGVVGINLVWQTPTFQNGWTNYGGGYYPAGYALDQNGFVHLRGMIAGGGVPSVAFTLPAGYAPAAHVLLPAQTSSMVGMLQITSAGVVAPQTGSNVWYSLDNVQFPVAL